jgi:hypothetical protein
MFIFLIVLSFLVLVFGPVLLASLQRSRDLDA